MPTIRPLKSQTDLDAYMELCVYCFSMPPEYVSYYKSFVGAYLDQTWGAFEKDRLIAAMWAVPFEMNVGGAYLKMGGVAAVATYPEARNLGLAKVLMTRAHRDMRARGCALAVLQPFKPEFYARMGYGDVFYLQEMLVKPGSIATLDARGYSVTRVDGLREWKTFEALHEQYGANYFGAVRRTRHYWEKRYFTSGMGLRHSYLISKGKTPVGYIVAHIDKSRPSFAREAYQPSRLSIVQAVWTDQGSFDSILQFIRAHRDQYDKVQWQVPTDVAIHDRLTDQRIDVLIRPKKMLKLIDLKLAFEQRPWARDIHGDIFLQVKGEDTSPWNDGLWHVRWKNGVARVTKAKSAPRNATVRTDIQSLAVLYSGHRSASRLTELGMISGSPEAIGLLGRVVPKQNCYIDEWF